MKKYFKKFLFVFCVIIVLLVVFLKGEFIFDRPKNNTKLDKILKKGTKVVDSKSKANKLIDSISPYLLQHAYNPVDWYPWGEAAFEKARRENKIILLSIGYSTCYWCHVMERETFENHEIASTMNENIVSIKIDREQHPAVDDIYMTATHLITGSGGWPNNVFVTPDLEPFYAGTYFPPTDRGNKLGFKSIVKSIGEQWKNNPQSIISIAKKLTNAVVDQKTKEQGPTTKMLPNLQVIDRLQEHFYNFYDAQFGGFYQAPKFPNEDALLFLLALYQVAHNKRALEVAQNSLQKMSEGGIRDHVGGGFHRYATDSRWKIPHFEKMLYNQALLGKVYTNLFSISQMLGDREIAEGIFDYVIRQMTHPEGGFYSALDAETDQAEGAYYVWTEQELRTVLNEADYRWLLNSYALAEIPKIPGHKHADGKVLYLREQSSQSTLEDGFSYQEKINKNKQIIKILHESRSKRKLPHLDDKIISGWNGLMIDAFSRAAVVLEKEEYKVAAISAAEFVISKLLKSDGSLFRIWKNARLETRAYFEDYAFVIQGLVSVFRMTNNKRYLEHVERLLDKADSLFWDNGRGGYYFSEDSKNLIVRSKNARDSAIPSGNSVMANALIDLYEFTGERKWKDKAETILKAFSHVIASSPSQYTHMVQALLRIQNVVPSQVSIPKDISTEIGTDPLQTSSKVKITVTSLTVASNKINLSVLLDISQGWHVNVNPASLDTLVPTSFDIRDDTGNLRVSEIEYPYDIHEIESPLGKIRTWSGKVPISLAGEAKDTYLNPRLLIKAQACSDSGSCLLPSDWALSLE